MPPAGMSPAQGWQLFIENESRKRYVIRLLSRTENADTYDAIYFVKVVGSSSTNRDHRTMYCLYYLDAQISVCCNLRPLLTALELKYECEYHLICVHGAMVSIHGCNPWFR